MRTKTLCQLLRKRFGAFACATGVVTALWLVAVLAVDVLAPSPHLGAGNRRFVDGVGKTFRGPAPTKARSVVIFLRDGDGGGSGFAAWHKVVLVLILVTLAAIVVAGIDQLRRKNRRSRRVRTV
jgi:hypothetical protein